MPKYRILLLNQRKNLHELNRTFEKISYESLTFTRHQLWKIHRNPSQTKNIEKMKFLFLLLFCTGRKAQNAWEEPDESFDVLYYEPGNPDPIIEEKVWEIDIFFH